MYWQIFIIWFVFLNLDTASAENGTNPAYLDTCFAERDGIFPCSSTITGNLLLTLFYGGILAVAAKLISDGAEILLDLGFSPRIIGGIVLPVLGAVPDCAIIIASGIGEDAQEKLSIGMGTLAGSTVMLLTFLWAASLIVARCEIDSNENMSLDKKCYGYSLTKQGITLFEESKSGVYIMLVTSLFFLIVQIADWVYGPEKTDEQPKYVKNAAFATMVISIVALIAYTVYSVLDSKRIDSLMRLRREEIAARNVIQTLIMLANKQTFKPTSPRVDLEDGIGSTSAEGINTVEDEEDAIAKKYFKAWHMKKGTRLARERIHHGSICDELDGNHKEKLLTPHHSVSEDSDEYGPESKLSLAIKCIIMLITGVALVTLFSEPMCGAIAALAEKSNHSYIPIDAFYISFVITSISANASEFSSSLAFAKKKTRETATMTFSQLFGASTLKNTLCLAIFMALVSFNNLKWYYGAEVLCMITVQWIVGLISLSKTYKVWMAIPVVLTYPFCLMLVYVLEKGAHWH